MRQGRAVGAAADVAASVIGARRVEPAGARLRRHGQGAPEPVGAPGQGAERGAARVRGGIRARRFNRAPDTAPARPGRGVGTEGIDRPSSPL